MFVYLGSCDAAVYNLKGHGAMMYADNALPPLPPAMPQPYGGPIAPPPGLEALGSGHATLGSQSHTDVTMPTLETPDAETKSPEPALGSGHATLGRPSADMSYDEILRCLEYYPMGEQKPRYLGKNYFVRNQMDESWTKNKKSGHYYKRDSDKMFQYLAQEAFRKNPVRKRIDSVEVPYASLARVVSTMRQSSNRETSAFKWPTKSINFQWYDSIRPCAAELHGAVEK